jgi:mono/diheme cytochrome c family protein
MYMKRKYLFLTLAATVLFLQCATEKITYSIPANYPEARKKELIAIFEKGKVLFKDNCSQCHGVFTRAKESVPDFSVTQIDNYSSKFLRRDPRNHAVAMSMSPDQLNEILIFLRFKKTKTVDTTNAKKSARG